MEKNGKIKVVIVINDFLVGGAQRLITHFLKHADHDQFDFAVVTLFDFSNKNTLFSDIPKTIPVYKFSFFGVSDIKSWWNFYILLRKLKPQVVLSHLFFSNLISRFLGIFLRYTVISCEHNTYIYKPFWQRLFDKFLSHFSYKIIAVSKTVAEFTSKQEGIPMRKFAIIHNGIDIEQAQKEFTSLPSRQNLREQFGLNLDSRVLLNVSRLTVQKNHKSLLEGFAVFSKNHPEYKLVIVGDGALLPNLKGLVEQQKIQDKVVFAGMQKNVWQFYKIADAYISTSKIEGLSMTYLEALSAGLPLIATSTAGTDEIIVDNKNGFFVKTSETVSVSEALEKLHKSNLSELSKGAMETVKNFDIKKMTQRYQELINSSL